MLLGQIIRVHTIGQGHAQHLEISGHQCRDMLHGRFRPCGIPIEQQHHTTRLCVEKLALMLRKRRATGRHGILHTIPGQGNHVHLPLANIYAALTRDGLPGLP